MEVGLKMPANDISLLQALKALLLQIAVDTLIGVAKGQESAGDLLYNVPVALQCDFRL